MEGDQCNRHGSGDRNWIINLVGELHRISLSAPEYTTEDIYKLLKAYLPVEGDSIFN